MNAAWTMDPDDQADLECLLDETCRIGKRLIPAGHFELKQFGTMWIATYGGYVYGAPEPDVAVRGLFKALYLEEAGE